jgi:hypothetical protein
LLIKVGVWKIKFAVNVQAPLRAEMMFSKERRHLRQPDERLWHIDQRRNSYNYSHKVRNSNCAPTAGLFINSEFRLLNPNLVLADSGQFIFSTPAESLINRPMVLQRANGSCCETCVPDRSCRNRGASCHDDQCDDWFVQLETTRTPSSRFRCRSMIAHHLCGLCA